VNSEAMSANLKIVEPDFSGVIDAATEINARQRELKIRLKRARMALDVDLTFQLVDELIPDSVLEAHDKKVSSITSRKYGRTSGR